MRGAGWEGERYGEADGVSHSKPQLWAAELRSFGVVAAGRVQEKEGGCG